MLEVGPRTAPLDGPVDALPAYWSMRRMARSAPASDARAHAGAEERQRRRRSSQACDCRKRSLD
eukprot:scaffold244861_cov30-Tisochrysis_lutea.AAC.2